MGLIACFRFRPRHRLLAIFATFATSSCLQLDDVADDALPRERTGAIVDHAIGNAELQETPDDLFAIRDSAGITIVESTGPTWNETNAWRLTPAPILQIGADPHEPEVWFGAVSMVRRLTDGRYAVADPRSARIDVFDASGAHLQSFGRSGQGPGEFQSTILSVGQYRSDSIFVWEVGRLSVFDSSGQFARAVRPSFPQDERGMGTVMMPFRGELLDVFPDGSLLAHAGFIVRGDWGERIPYSYTYLRYSPSGELIDTVGTSLGGEISIPASPQSRPLPAPYPPRMVFALDSMDLFLGTNTSIEFEQRGQDGTLIRILRSFDRDLALSNEEKESYLKWLREILEGGSRTSAALSSVQFPEVIPPYDRALVDSERNLWFRHYRLESDTVPQTWGVFSPAGAMLGNVQTPPELYVTQIDSDIVLGYARVALGVSVVQVYGLDRSR